MGDYFEVLGVPKTATEAEIKRAYFKLVRQYSPEKEPEKFQQIREAYERLRDHKEDLLAELCIPDIPFAKKMYETARKAEQDRNFGYMSLICEEALEYYPGSSGFSYLLGRSQRLNGHSGKAVKTLEALVQANSEEAQFVKELALAYDERGFYKKAFPLFQKAYELGIRNAEFLLDYSICCDSNRKPEVGRKVLFTLMDEGKSEKKFEMDNFVDALAGCYRLDSRCRKSEMDRVNGLLQKNLARLAPWLEEQPGCLGGLMESMLEDFVEHDVQAEYAVFERDILAYLHKTFRTQDAKEELHQFQELFTLNSIYHDSRLGMCTELVAEAYCESEVRLMDIDVKAEKFLRLEAQLLLIDEIPQIWEEIAILEKEYPFLYEKIRGFVESIRECKNMDYIKERLLKDYRRSYKYMSLTFYAQRHPEEMRDGVLISDGDGEQPYVRRKPKIGRNDPCPCGSGKKYKHCCGR